MIFCKFEFQSYTWDQRLTSTKSRFAGCRVLCGSFVSASCFVDFVLRRPVCLVFASNRPFISQWKSGFLSEIDPNHAVMVM